jgi:hypothetical protein
MAQAYYHLGLYDMLSRNLCKIETISVDRIPRSAARSGFLHDEIKELVHPGRPQVYASLLASAGFTDIDRVRVMSYLLSVNEDTLAPPAREGLQLAIRQFGLPKNLPVPECHPDDMAKEILQAAQHSMAAAHRGTKMRGEPKGVVVILRDKMESLSGRIDMFLSGSAPKPSGMNQPGTSARTAEERMADLVGRYMRDRVAMPDNPLMTAAKATAENAEKLGSPFNFGLAGQLMMVQGDLGSAFDALRRGIAYDAKADAPHALLGEAYYYLYLFDAFSRDLCTVELQTIDRISPHLSVSPIRLEIREMVADGRPRVYRTALASLGFGDDERGQALMYLLSLTQERLEPEARKALNSMAARAKGPSRLPVPTCHPDGDARFVLGLAETEIRAAALGVPTKGPAKVILVDPEDRRILAGRIHELLGPARSSH